MILKQLNEILETKKFSNSVKEMIQDTISEAYDVYSRTNNKKTFFENLVKGLFSVNEFRINTRKQLSKRENVTSHLTDCALGFTTIDRFLVAVVKEQNEKSAIYYEMIHLTQSPTSYQISENYPFSQLLNICLLEGEASYYETDLLDDNQSKKVEILKSPNGEKLALASKDSYPFYSMIYKSLLDIFGEEVMTKWKNIDAADIMPLLKETFEKKFPETPFIVFYQILTKMLVEYFVKVEPSKNSKYQSYIVCEIKKLGVKNLLLKKTNAQYETILSFIKGILQNIEQTNSYLTNEKLMNDSLQQLIKKQKKELEEYQESPEYDIEVGMEWKHEIETVTLDDYKKNLLKELEEYKKELANLVKEKNKLLKDIESQDYFKINAEGYLDDEYRFLFCHNFLSSKLSANALEDFEICTLTKTV